MGAEPAAGGWRERLNAARANRRTVRRVGFGVVLLFLVILIAPTLRAYWQQQSDISALRWILGGMTVWLVWATFLSGHSFLKLWRLNRENARTERELAGSRAELGRLDAQLESPRALKGLAERALREQSGMAKPGEIVYRIRSSSDSATTR